MGSEYDLTPGDRIKLIKMEGEKVDEMPEGLEGTVRFTDGAGHVHVDWDNGRGLALIPKVDLYEQLDRP